MDADDAVEDFDIEDEEEELLEDFVEDEDDEAKQKVKDNRASKFLMQHHPECRVDYVEDVAKRLSVTGFGPKGKDPNHGSVPYLTQFERTKIIGFRSNQLSQGARPFIQVPSHVTDVMDIARLELEQKRLPFLLKRPMPDGTYEYFRLQELVVL
jgi:DNA-directed RNA polymerase I, II, and III subunit RPABC2